MAYTKTNWAAGVTPLSEANMDHLETQYDEVANLFDAHSILMAVADNTPVVLTVAASRLIGRTAATDIDDLTGAQVMVILSGQAGADFSMNTNKITNVTDPGANQDAATKKYVDDNASLLTVSETEVYSGNSPNAWTDLDLSGTIGSVSALVLLKIFFAADRTFAVRKNGDIDEQYLNGSSAGAGRGDSASNFAVFLVATDTSGVIEWISDTITAATTVDVVAYIVV